jgi:hypothetical protein
MTENPKVILGNPKPGETWTNADAEETITFITDIDQALKDPSFIVTTPATYDDKLREVRENGEYRETFVFKDTDTDNVFVTRLFIREDLYEAAMLAAAAEAAEDIEGDPPTFYGEAAQTFIEVVKEHLDLG